MTTPVQISKLIPYLETALPLVSAVCFLCSRDPLRLRYESFSYAFSLRGANDFGASITFMEQSTRPAPGLEKPSFGKSSSFSSSWSFSTQSQAILKKPLIIGKNLEFHL